MLDTQVAPTSLKIGVIGPGRLGRALAWSLAGRGCCVHAVAGRTPAGAAVLAARIEGCLILPAQGLAEQCDLIFVTTPDDAIRATAESVRWRAGTGVAHCSGATELDALAKATADGALAGGFHPMQSFADSATATRTLPGCVITIEAAEPLNRVLVGLARHLGCRVNQLPPGVRARYHAAAGYASQYVNVLLAEAARIWRSWGASEAEALQALVPLVRGTLSSIEAAGLARGMSGPVSRGDAATVAKHLASLVTLDEATAALYRELCLRSVTLARDAGDIDADESDEIRRVIGG